MTGESRQERLYLAFLEAYLTRMDPALAVQVWPTLFTFSKEIAAHTTIHKYRLLPALRCLTTLAEKFSQTSALEDRRMRRDLHETFLKLVDATVQMSGRTGGGLSQPANLSASTTSLASLATTPSEPNGRPSEKLENSTYSEKNGQPLKQKDSAHEVCYLLLV